MDPFTTAYIEAALWSSTDNSDEQGGDWEDNIGERLTDASDDYGGVDLYVGDDGLIYA